MNRRTFSKLALTSLPLATPAQPTPPTGKMKLGTQHQSSNEILKILAALGVSHICSELPSAKFDEAWSVASLTQLRERVESCGITLAAVPLPMSSSYITKAENPDIMLGRSPDRDREIDNICQMIVNCRAAGIPMLKYNLTILGVVRSDPTIGRGGAKYSTFVYEKAKQDPPLTEAGAVSQEMMWDRITYFLDRIVPVATQNKIKIACHPHDPGMPKAEGFRGVHRVLGTVDGLKRFIEIQPSPYHGLNFCQGTVSEMLQNPAAEIFDVIRYFGTRQKIFNVHFRNIHGHRLNFQETFPDAGDIDMVRAIKVYKEIGYDGMLMPDHVPTIEGDRGGLQAFAFSYGYIRGLMQSAGV